MKFPLTQLPGREGVVVDADNQLVPLHLLSTLTELVHRANAFDDLVAACKAAEKLAWEVGTETEDGVATLLADSRGDLYRQLVAALQKAGA